MHIDQTGQVGTTVHSAMDCGRGPQGQVAVYLGDGHFDRAIAKNLKHQGTIEFDVGLHQHSRRRHLTQQLMHRRGVGPGFGIGGTALQDGLPRIGQAHHHAAHRQAIKQKFMQFRHCFPFAGADKRAVHRFSRCGAAPF